MCTAPTTAWSPSAPLGSARGWTSDGKTQERTPVVETGSCDLLEDILEVLAMPWVRLGCGVQFLSFKL